MSAGTGLPVPGAQIRLDGRLVTVVAATPTTSGADLVVRHGDGSLADAVLTVSELNQMTVPGMTAEATRNVHWLRSTGTPCPLMIETGERVLRRSGSRSAGTP